MCVDEVAIGIVGPSVTHSQRRGNVRRGYFDGVSFNNGVGIVKAAVGTSDGKASQRLSVESLKCVGKLKGKGNGVRTNEVRLVTRSAVRQIVFVVEREG